MAVEMVHWISPIAAAAVGAGLVAWFGMWKRREQLKGIIFNKKVGVYSRLVGITFEMLYKQAFTLMDERIAHVVSKDAEKLTLFVGENLLFITDDILVACKEFTKTAVNTKLGFEKKVANLRIVHNALCNSCRRELGMKKLEEEIELSS